MTRQSYIFVIFFNNPEDKRYNHGVVQTYSEQTVNFYQELYHPSSCSRANLEADEDTETMNCMLAKDIVHRFLCNMLNKQKLAKT